MPSLKRIPTTNPQHVECTDAESAMEEVVAVQDLVEDSIKAAENRKDVDKQTSNEDDIKGPTIEPTVTDEHIENGSENSEIVKETDESRKYNVTKLKKVSEGHEEFAPDIDDQSKMECSQDNKNTDVNYQHQEAPAPIGIDESSLLELEESVLPYEPNSINHSILARFIATPFNACTMKLLHVHKDDKDWDAILPVMDLPILSQKRCIQLAKRNANKKTPAEPKSPWRALSHHNVSVARKDQNPQDMLPPQSFMMNPHFQQTNPNALNATSTLSGNALSYQISNQNSASQSSQPYAVRVMHNHSQATAAMPYFSQAQSGFFHPQFYPPGLNNGYLNNFQQYQMSQLIQAQNASLNATNPSAPAAPSIPQVTASKPIVIDESSKESVAKLPVAFGFHLDNEQSRILAEAAAQKWYQQGLDAMQTSAKLKSKSGATKTPHKKSSSTTPKASPRMSPVAVPTPAHKVKGLPEGWTAQTYKRVGGTSVGSTDTYFYSPLNKIKFRSKNKIALFVEILGEVGGDEKRAFELFKERGHRV